MLSPERYDRLREIFFAVAERAPEERQAYLDQACAGDPEARREVEALLARDAADTDSLQPDGERARAGRRAIAEMLIGIPAEPPAAIGRYRVTRRLAVGGMGCVYEAEQESPQRRVALKVLHPGLASARMLRRFEFESQVLARLRHPGIAQVFEAGTMQTQAGPQAFFAMELIDGKPILEHAQDRRLTSRQRLELLARVCDAVHHAHQKGVIHRDLKPANILVIDEETEKADRREPGIGQPKVLDFGVARVTDLELQTTTLRTDAGQLIGTVPYMSPEQASGARDAVDTRSDVYTLGVLGYELLAGRHPQGLDDLALHQALEAIRVQEPPRLGSLDSTLRGDVETIIAKALEKDPQRRYDSAASLAADLRRHLHHEPIQACPPTFAYQLRKFARRHRSLVLGGIAAVSIGTLGTMVGLVRANLQAHAAMLARDDAEALAQFFVSMLGSESAERLGRDVLVRDILDDAAGRVTGSFAHQPLLQARLRFTIALAYSHLGDHSAAMDHAAAALEIRDRILGTSHRDTIEARRALYGAWIAQGMLPEAAVWLRNLAADYNRLFGPDDLATLITERDLGSVERQRRRLTDAEPLLTRSAAGLLRINGTMDPDALHAQGELASLYANQGRYDEAEALFHRTLDSWRQADPSNPSAITHANNLGLLYIRRRRFDEAESLYLDLADRLRGLGEDHARLLGVLGNLAVVYNERGQFHEAVGVNRDLVARRTRALGPTHQSTLIAMSNLATSLRGLGEYDEAESLLLKTLTLCREVNGPGHEHEFHILNGLGLQYVIQDRDAEAEPLLRDAYLGAKGMFVEGDNRTARFRRNYGRCLAKLGRFEEAEPHLLEGYQDLLTALGPDHDDTLRSVKYLAQLYEAWNRPEDAAVYRALLPPQAEPATPPDTAPAGSPVAPADPGEPAATPAAAQPVTAGP
jgi:tetratricopeptide (TPR) repeat protein/tRNA A-37 threonylcarbamoyl transferase component Bud32